MSRDQPQRKKRLLILLAVVLMLGGVGYSYYRHHYPYGNSHHCSKAVVAGLLAYADDHVGAFPSAKNSAEALVLLADYVPIEFLAGKSVKPSETTEYYTQHGTLSEEVCGWHYVSGLKSTDSGEITIMWPKVPLGHNGERLKEPAYEVIFVDGSVRYIKELSLIHI